jgi:hypothetical protein
MKLPVFKVSGAIAPAEKIRDLGKRIFPGEDQEIVERGTQVELRCKSGSVKVDAGKGGVWAADSGRLWRFDPLSGEKRGLIRGADAERQSLEILTRHSVIPEIKGPFRLKQTRITGSVTVSSPTENASRQVIQEDTTVLADIEVNVSSYGIDQKTLPIVGGGGRFGVVFGEGGRLLATHGVWRTQVGQPKMMEVIPKSKADEAYSAC